MAAPLFFLKFWNKCCVKNRKKDWDLLVNELLSHTTVWSSYHTLQHVIATLMHVQ